MGFKAAKLSAECDSNAGKREADALRMVAFFGVCLSTIAAMICVVRI